MAEGQSVSLEYPEGPLSKMPSAFESYSIIGQSLPSLSGSGLIGGLLAAAGWAGTYYFARLWNRSYRLQFRHHLLCGVAAVITFLSVPVWASVSSMEDAIAAIDATLEKTATSEDWQRKAFEQAYEAVEGSVGRLEQEDFPSKSSSRKQERQISLTDSTSERAVAHAYVKHAIYSIARKYPQLEPLLRRVSAEATRSLVSQLRSFSGENVSIYPSGRVAQQMTSKISATFLTPIRLWMWRIRLMVVSLFLLTQVLAFGTVGISAVHCLNV